MKATAEDLTAIGALVEDLCGIVLDQTKGYLIENRFGELVGELGCASYSELARRVRQGGEADLKSKVIDAITTNETLFFRDGSPFEAFKHKSLPETIDEKLSRGDKTLRIWSAACSTGQEPYTLAMILHDTLGKEIDDFNIRILATDISDEVIEKASRGVFTEYEVGRGLPAHQLSKYFHREDGKYRVKDELRYLVSFKRTNLLESLAHVGTQDIVFCRNVAIYFQRDARDSLYRRIQKQMSNGGYLFVGSGETLVDLGEDFVPHSHCRSVFYRPNGV